MQSRTEGIEEKRRQVRKDRFKTLRRIIDCLEAQQDKRKCLDCSDRSLCRRIQDATLL